MSIMTSKNLITAREDVDLGEAEKILLTHKIEKLLITDKEETDWRKELESARQIVPEIRPLLVMCIMKGGSK